jgi:hypothetical protein
MKTLITIDFDFFMPEDPALDIGHQESLAFLKMLWASRIGLMDKLSLDGKELVFWDWLKKRVDVSKAPMFVSDSHCYAYNLLKDVNGVISFDAHHDCWEGDSLGVDKSEKGIYCHNWLRAWLEGSKKRQAVWVATVWLDKECGVPEGIGRLERRVWSQFTDLGIEGSVIVHICRSGCWVPPWLDKAFLGFLRASGRGFERMVVLQDGEWSPLAERWSEKDLQDALAQEAKIQQAFKKMGMAIGTISSRNFLNYKVEQRV